MLFSSNLVRLIYYVMKYIEGYIKIKTLLFLNIVRQNTRILDDWVKKEPRITYFKPEAGTIAMLKYDFDVPSEKFCLDLF
jgi:hypothetical protein